MTRTPGGQWSDSSSDQAKTMDQAPSGGAVESSPGAIVDALSLSIAQNRSRIALLFESGQSTYSELWVAISAKRLRLQRAAVGPRARVAISCHEPVNAITWWMAVMAAGAVACLIPQQEPEWYESRVFPHFIAYDDELRATSATASRGPSGYPSGTVLFSSGTTNAAKPIFHSQDTMMSLVANLMRLRSETVSRGIDLLNGDADELCRAPRGSALGLTYASGMPIWTMAGVTVALQALFDGDRVAMIENEDARSFLESLCRHEVTNVSLTPLMARRMVRLLRSEHFDHKMLFIAVGGAAVDSETAEMLEHFSRAVVACGYGSTESGALSIARFDAAPAARHGSVGKPLPGVEARIEDGQLLVRSASLCLGYLSDDCESIVGCRVSGWWNTKDRASWTDDGNLSILGRSDDAIIRSGQVVLPLALERAIESLSGVEQASVVGCRSVLLPEEEDIVAAVVRRLGSFDLTQIEVQQACFNAVGVAPQRVLWFDDLPIGSDGSIKRNLVRAEVRDRLNR